MGKKWICTIQGGGLWQSGRWATWIAHDERTSMHPAAGRMTDLTISSLSFWAEAILLLNSPLDNNWTRLCDQGLNSWSPAWISSNWPSLLWSLPLRGSQLPDLHYVLSHALFHPLFSPLFFDKLQVQIMVQRALLILSCFLAHFLISQAFSPNQLPAPLAS